MQQNIILWGRVALQQHPHHCLLSLSFHNSKTPLMTPPVTVRHEVEVYEPLILMHYVLVFPWQPERQICQHMQVRACMNVCIDVRMVRRIRGRKIVFVVNVYECVCFLI